MKLLTATRITALFIILFFAMPAFTQTKNNSWGHNVALISATQHKAEQGEEYAQFRLGNYYFEGEIVAKDFAKAIFWYTKAAEQGNPEAQSNLGVMYINGMGVSKDVAKAIYWWNKAAAQGNAGAQRELAVSYKIGNGVPKNQVKAVEWFTKAAEQGQVQA